MKTFVSGLTLGLIVAFSAPAFAASDAPKDKTEQSHSKTAKQPEKTAKQQEKKPMY
jgi:hypothetical protein